MQSLRRAYGNAAASSLRREKESCVHLPAFARGMTLGGCCGATAMQISAICAQQLAITCVQRSCTRVALLCLSVRQAVRRSGSGAATNHGDRCVAAAAWRAPPNSVGEPSSRPGQQWLAPPRWIPCRKEGRSGPQRAAPLHLHAVQLPSVRRVHHTPSRMAPYECVARSLPSPATL